ncbi:periplasmic heavy metal sensor [candidate division KSB1 bacterium]|nr:periplasmic heavy metal sensor [candidate division KSB1 bacterium]
MKRFIIIQLFISGFILSIVSMSFAQESQRFLFKTRENSGPLDWIPELTKEQATKIEAMQIEHQKAMAPLNIQLSKLNLELKELMIADKPDMGKINKKLEEISRQKLDIHKKMVIHHLDIRALLTDKQKLAFDKRGMRLRGHREGVEQIQRLRIKREGEKPIWIEEEEIEN